MTETDHKPTTDAATDPDAAGAPEFDAAFRARLLDLFRWRRDVRRFRGDPLPPGAMDDLLAQAALAPSVGNSQPWRFVLVGDTDRRQAVKVDFEAANADALKGYSGDRARAYAGLKLAGLDQAPVQLAVYADMETARGHGLGQKTMPEMLPYSVVAAVNTFWLAARARGIGVGWVSILHPDRIAEILDLPADWRLVAYLCVGYPEEEHIDPELVRAAWQDRADPADFIVRR